MTTAAAWLLGALSLVAAARGDVRAHVAIGSAGPAPVGLAVLFDDDDDDEDGVRDARQNRDVPGDDLLWVEVRTRGPGWVRARGGVRLVVDGRPTAAVRLSRGGRHLLAVQGIEPSRTADHARLVVEDGARRMQVGLTVVAVRWESGAGPLDPSRAAVRVSRAIPSLASLAAGASVEAPAGDADDVRLELVDPSTSEAGRAIVLRVRDPASGRVRGERTIALHLADPNGTWRSPWLRLVTDDVDASAPGVSDRVLRVALRDEVRAVVPGVPGAASIRVGRPGREGGPDAAMLATLRVRVLRRWPGGPPVIGADEAAALRLAREQVRIANEVWAQCAIGFGAPERADVAVVDPPPAALVSIGDGDGLPAYGGGVVRMRVGGRPIEPVTTRAGASPLETAVAIARALRRAGAAATVVRVPRIERAAGPSADVVVRDRTGRPLPVERDGDAPWSTDARQRVEVHAVDLSDGLLEFDNGTAVAGSPEERALVAFVADDDPRTLDVIVVDRFMHGTRQGEAFIAADGGSITNVVILDRNGIHQQRQAWTQSHEIGHVLIDHPFHPDDVGPDRPHLLMDSDSSLGLVTGPKRLERAECARARHRSAALLFRRPDPAAVPFENARGSWGVRA
ncbi:MAG: hypothetical protein NZ898_10195 [Myxococcota bacterium]|nr:hypothetical protein [Myxococcota bacterium]MDW8363821.1 hypothetical protein [Myxococcales bacterium]